MTKYEFLAALEQRLSALPREDRKRSLDFYAEMIDDRVDEGMTEEAAVESLGSLDDIVSEITGGNESSADAPKEEPKEKKKLSPWIWAVILVGSPLWLSLLIGGIGLLVGLVAGILGGVVGIVASGFGLLVGALALLVGGIVACVVLSGNVGLLLFGAAFICGGLGLAWTVFCLWIGKRLWNLLGCGRKWLRSHWKKEGEAA